MSARFALFGLLLFVPAVSSQSASYSPGRLACDGGRDFGFAFTAGDPDPISGRANVTVVPGGAFDEDYALGQRVFVTDNHMAGPFPLPFPFSFGGVTFANGVHLSDNGSIADGFFTPTFEDPNLYYTYGGGPSYNGVRYMCVLATDLDPEADGAEIWVHTTPSFMSVTWVKTPQKFTGNGPTDSLPEFARQRGNTFQVQLHSNSSLVYFYKEFEIVISPVRSDPASRGSRVTIGAKGLGSAGPMIDLSGVGSQGATVLGAIWESFYDETQEGDFFDLDDKSVPSSPQVFVQGRPVLGLPLYAYAFPSFPQWVVPGVSLYRDFVLALPSGVLAPTFSLGIIDPRFSACRLLADYVTPGAVIGLAAGFTIPNDPSLAGLEGLVISGIEIRFHSDGSPFDFVGLDEVNLRLGF
jgi:hypothetical protein